MKKLINLVEYVGMLGSLSKLNITKTWCTYSDNNNDKPIENITLGRVTNPSFRNPNGVQLYVANFCDGSSHEYSGMWINTEVEFILVEKYK